MNPWTDSFEQYRQSIIGEDKKKSDKKEPRWQDDDCDGKWYEKSDVDGKISDREKKEKKKHYAKEDIADIIARLEKKRISKGGDPKDSPLPSMKKYHEKKKKKVKEEVVGEGKKKGLDGKACWDGYKLDGTKKKGGKTVDNCVKEEDIEVNHIDGSKTQIIDVIKAPKMPSAAAISEMDGSKLGIGLAAGIAGGGLTLIKKTVDTAKSLKKKMQQRTGTQEQYSNWREDFIWEGPATAKDPKLDVKETGVKNKIEVNPEVKTEEKKNLVHTSPLTDRVLNWSKTKKTEDYHRGKGEIKQKRTKAWMSRQNPPIEGAPGLDAYRARQKEHEDNRGKGKKKVSEGSAYGLWKGDGKRKLPGDKKKKEDVKEAKVDKKLPEYKRATARDKRYGNPHGSHELGGGIRKDRRADHEERRRKKTKVQENSVKYYSGQDRDPKTGLPKGLKGSGSGSKKETPLTGVDYSKLQASYEPKFSVFDEAADRKMARATDQQLADAHKKFSGMDQSSPANAHMTKRITREINRRKKAAKSAQGSSPVKEEVGVSSSASIKKAKQEAELQRREALAKKKKGVKEHHQKDSNGKVIEHGDGSPSSLDELNRYEKETGKSSGSMNMPKGRKTKKGGDSSEVMRSVRTSIRRETGKPTGQRKTRERGEKTADMKGPSAKLQKGISKLKAKRELDAKARKAGFTNTQDYIEKQARYPD